MHRQIVRSNVAKVVRIGIVKQDVLMYNADMGADLKG